MSIFIVGLTNQLFTGALEPWTPNGAGERLWKMIDEVEPISKSCYLRKFNLVNVIDSGPRWVSRLVGSSPAVVLGREAWSLLELARDVGWHESHFNWHLVPHPSGRCHLYNDAAMRRKTGELIWRLARLRS